MNYSDEYKPARKPILATSSDMNEKLKDILGQTLDLICVNRTQIVFHFGLRFFIQIEEQYNLYDSSIAAPQPVIPPQLPSGLLGPIEQEVVECVIDTDKILHVRFANGWILEAYPYDIGFIPYEFMIDGEEVRLS